MEKRLMTFVAMLLFFVGGAMAQTKVNGTVVSQEDNQPVIGASVLVVGTNVGTVTNSQGKFSLTLPQGKSHIRVTYVGMQTQSLAAHDGIVVRLGLDANAIDEVLVVAYGTTKKSSFTGSAAAISSDKLELRPVTNVSKALDGQVAGVTVTAGSGQPGSGSTILIRGFGSINASNNPLYVVDGMPYDGAINAINPQDIESMTVLKDASASALYGSRAANGVVIITTKKGKEGRPQVQLHNSLGWSWRALPKYDLVSQSEFVELTYEALRNDYMYNNGQSFDNASQAALSNLGSYLGPQQYNPWKKYSWAELIDPATSKIRPDAVSSWNENWMDELYDEGALRHEHSLSVNGGSEKTSYMMSLGFVDDNGILKETGFQRYSGRANVESQVTDWFKAGLNTNLAHTKSTYNQYAEGTSSSATSNPWYTAQFMAPIYPLYEKDAEGNTIYDAYGKPQLDYGEQGRPVAADQNSLGSLTMDHSWNTRDNASVRTFMTFGSDKESYGWAQGLKLTLAFGADYSSMLQTETMNKYHGNQKNAGGRMEKWHTRDFSYTFNQQLTWNRSFDKHNIGFLLGHEFYQYTYNFLLAGKTNIVDGINELRPASTTYEADSYSHEHDIEAYFGRVNYNYDDKYYLDASLRRDGSSRFYKDNRWGTFWSVGANWRISAEEFMKPLTWVNNLSLKASYGENGNERLDSYYAWQSLYNLEYANGGKIGGFISTLENKDLSWEKSGMFNAGLEGTLFDNRLRFSVEYFNKKTTDMLLNYPLPLSTGFTGYDANVGNMRNTGWEFMLSGTLLSTKDFVWNLTWMGTAQRNKVLKLTEQTDEIINGVQIIKEGHDLRTFYMAKSAGVDPTTGQQLYWAYDDVDIYEQVQAKGENGQPLFDENNKPVMENKLDKDGNPILLRTERNEYITSDYSKAVASKYFVGKRTPDLYGSISTDMKFFGCVDLSILTTYSLGGKIYDSMYYSSMNQLYYGSQNWNKNVLRRWQQPGDVTDIPRVEVGGNRATTSNFLVDASYFAIKNITLGYTLPSKLARKAYLTGVRLYTSFDNVAIFTHLKGMNPQYNLTGGTDYRYAANKTFSVGLDINF